jgi:hypothetical protein
MAAPHTAARNATISNLPSSSMAAAPSSSCGFFDLPPELRNWTYELVLIKEDVIEVSGSQPSRAPALVQVNRQIRTQGLQLYYSTNILKYENMSIYYLVRWVRSIGAEARAALREVRWNNQCKCRAVLTDRRGFLADAGRAEDEFRYIRFHLGDQDRRLAPGVFRLPMTFIREAMSQERECKYVNFLWTGTPKQDLESERRKFMALSQE